MVEAGSPAFPYTELERDRVWAQNVASLYDQATAQQWDASTDIAWHELPALPSHVERAVGQIMTHLAENEYAALYVPSKFIPRIHPHFTEVVLFLATQVVDEARHIEAFTKRALASGGQLGISAAITQRSLKSLLDQEDFSQASFLLSVLGEGAFLEYLAFVERYAPDPVTADVVRRARADESRHVAFGVEHARLFLAADPERGSVLRQAVEQRAEFLSQTSGATPHVEEALVDPGGRRDVAGGVAGWCSSGPGAPRDDAQAAGGPAPSARLRRVDRQRDLGAPHRELHVSDDSVLDLLDRVAAVDHDRLAGEVTRAVACEERDDLRDLLRRPRAADRRRVAVPDLVLGR